MKAIDQLPPEYDLKATLDLSKNKLALLGVNLFGFVMLFGCGWSLLYLMVFLRPSRSMNDYISFDISSLASGVGFILAVALLVVAVLGLHEAVHGLFFWIFTHERPVFGLRGLYAYAAAPRWYIPRGQYAMVGIAPLVVLTAAGLVLTLVVPEGWLPVIFAFMLLNASGAAGDVIVVGWLLTRPREALAQDRGDAVSLFEPGQPAVLS